MLGVRPEAARLVPPGTGVLTGLITLVEPLHPDVFVTVDVGAGQSLVMRTDTDQRPAFGDRVGVALDIDALHLFDADGDRVSDAHH
jgi:ABC-type sugar transport system ATPase subunit